MPHNPKIIRLPRPQVPPVTAPWGSEEWKEQVATRALVAGPFARLEVQ